MGFTERQGKLLSLSAAIDLDSRLTVGCAGAVLAYVARHKAMESLPGGEEGNLTFEITALQMFSLANTV